jgi:hypothetical protein
MQLSRGCLRRLTEQPYSCVRKISVPSSVARAPSRFEGWLQSDRPQLSIHIILFKDAILLTITFLHTLMDAMGLADLLQAWTAVLSDSDVLLSWWCLA